MTGIRKRTAPSATLQQFHRRRDVALAT
jgi:hypothetical protein